MGKQDSVTNDRNSTSRRSKPIIFLQVANRLLGVVVMIVLAYHWAGYLAQLHDNQFWFVNIKEVKREISFRTEQGLYYSYYKQLVHAHSLDQGMSELRSDTITEHGRTINIFHRFNIHQELFLAALYRVINFGLRPIFFYIYSVFSLQGMFLCAMYLITWNLSGTWLSGVLMTAFLICHRMNVTRVEFTIPLREHFSLPFIFSQFFAIGLYFDAKGRKYEKLHLMAIYLLTFLLTVTWQFAQFVLLLQGLVLFAFALLGILENNKVSKILATILGAIVTVWYLQFYQPMVLNSLVVSLIPVAIVILQSYNEGRVRRPGIWNNLQWSIVKIGLGIISTIVINTLLKVLSGQDADNHIFRFVQSKFGFVDQTDFETRLYLCLPIFQPLPWQYYLAMNESGSMSLYCAFVILEVILIALSVFWHWHHKAKPEDKASKHEPTGIYHWFRSNPDVDFIRDRKMSQGWCFHIGQSLILAILAMTTLRMKCFWGPYICIFASVMVCHPGLWSFVVSKLGGGRGNWKLTNLLRHIILASCIFALYSSYKGRIHEELEDLKEFHDPDTVELMEWIPKQTPPNAAFTGSMQLLAGVKLCTGRPLTNHPHFEDKELRHRTKELYQIYARKSPEEVHDILVKYNTSYIILEDSICLSRSDKRCNLPTTMDLTNGHIPDDGIRDPAHLVHAPHRRFCDEIRKGQAPFTRFFKKVFGNRTFRVYQVLP
ncbi:probable C-mannosyltransferase DPY19L3 [Tigriopus californicus]|nr:probable C-mannosyltransferase DPY19L3 [Tigriopus californicus]